MRSKEIVCFEENKEGNDFIIGDVHGNRDCLDEVLATLKQGDRLFIVGDLTDRGHDSEGVINRVRENQDKVFCTRGNHENLCLNALILLENLAIKKAGLFKSTEFQRFLSSPKNVDLDEIFRELNQIENYEFANEYAQVQSHLTGFRHWLVHLFTNELKENKIKVDGNQIVYEPTSKISEITNYMATLPYILHVKGKNPFNVVHADLPFEQSELEKRIQQNNYQLIEKEKQHATWARDNKKSKFQFLKRTEPAGVITYVGHNHLYKNDFPIVRPESHTVNIDVATYLINVSLVVNHSNKSATFIGKGIAPTNISNKKNELDLYLASENKKTNKRPSDQSFFEIHKRQKLDAAHFISIQSVNNIDREQNSSPY